jgi:hypothetical protein
MENRKHGENPIGGSGERPRVDWGYVAPRGVAPKSPYVTIRLRNQTTYSKEPAAHPQSEGWKLKVDPIK